MEHVIMGCVFKGIWGGGGGTGGELAYDEGDPEVAEVVMLIVFDVVDGNL